MGSKGYKQLDDENDREMAPMDATYMPARQDTFLGFQAALDMATIHARGADQPDPAGLTPQLRKFVDSMRKATNEGSHLGLSFGYSGLKFHPKGSARPILQNVTGSIQRGSVARSAIGCKATRRPMARYSWRAISPNSSTRAGSLIAARPRGSGHCEKAPEAKLAAGFVLKAWRGSLDRVTGMPSRVSSARC